ncbi:MAG: YihY/virulence factor BrkB family protein [Calditrichaeota bacterium]|nr:YihY/virulence factor BrkB family protein [Calditrichota bacterium]
MSRPVTVVYKFFKKDLWTIDLKEQPKSKGFFLSQLRILIYTARDFINNNCPLHASALTFYSLLSIVPVFALIFGISKGFGLQSSLKQKLLEELPEHTEVVEWIVKFADSLLEASRSGVFTGIGIAVLLWTALKVLNNIEETLNTIWKIGRSRSFIRKFSDYLSIMVLGPVLFFISSSIAVYIASQVADFTKNGILNPLHPIIMFLLKLTPYPLIWLLFTLMYMIIPNTKVKLHSALYGAIIAGTIYQLVQWIYIEFQVGVARYDSIYGSFAAIPLFLIWLQLSWFIVLLGAELSYAHQNIPLYLFEKKAASYSDFYKKVLLLNIVYVIIKNFEKGEPALSEKHIADQVEISENMAKEFLTILIKSNIISKLISGRRTFTYQPAKDINKITIAEVLGNIEKSGMIKTFDRSKAVPRKIMKILEGFSKDILKDPQNILVKDL